MYAFCTEYLLQVNIILHPTVVCLIAKALTHLPWASAKPGFVKHLQISDTGWAKPWCPTALGASWDSATPSSAVCPHNTGELEGGGPSPPCAYSQHPVFHHGGHHSPPFPWAPHPSYSPAP